MIGDVTFREASQGATSITHKHILSIINSKIAARGEQCPIRILDVGCGNCELLAYLETFLPRFNPGLTVELHGLDVSDSKIQFSDAFDKAMRMLSARFGHVHWESRITIISSSDPWPYSDERFDMVISNQVLEHVGDHDFFFAQNRRVLKTGGFAVHLFPVKNYIFEGHLHLPFVHRLKQWNALYHAIRMLSILRLGKWKHVAEKCSLHDYASSYADFLTFYCHYLSIGDLVRLGKKHGFRTNFSYTANFYFEKLKEVFRIKHRFRYPARDTHVLSVHFFKYIQCITLFLDKMDAYENYIAKYRDRHP